MRILIFSQYFWPENFRINDVAKSLTKRGNYVEVITAKPNYPQGKIFSGYKAFNITHEKYDDMSVNRIPIIARGKGKFSLGLNYISFVFSGIFFAPIVLKNKEFDVILIFAPSPILQTIPAIFFGWLKKIPKVLWVQDLWPESISATNYMNNNFLLSILRKLVKFIYKNVDLLLIQSKAFEGSIKNIWKETPIKYLPNSVDAIKNTTNINPLMLKFKDKFTIIFAGNIGSAQSIETVLEAAYLLKSYSDIHFIFLGDGSEKKWVESEIRDKKLFNLHLLGSFPFEAMPSFLCHSSALLVSLKKNEIFSLTIPSKVQMYLAAGRPIIGSIDGEASKIISEANAGICASAENPYELKEAILSLYNMPKEKRERLGKNGQDYFQENFNHEKLVDKLIFNLKEVLQNEK